MKIRLLILLFATTLLASCSQESSKAEASPNHENSYDIEYVKHLKGETRLYKDTNGCYWIGETDVSNLTQVMTKGSMEYEEKTVPMCD